MVDDKADRTKVLIDGAGGIIEYQTKPSSPHAWHGTRLAKA